MLDLLLHLAHLLAADDQENHLALGIGVHTAGTNVGGTALQILEDETLQLSVVIGDNEEQFIIRSTIEHIGQYARRGVDDQERVDGQEPTRRIGGIEKKSKTDHEQTRQHHKAISVKDSGRELDATILVEQHGHDIRATGRSLLTHDDTHADTDQD